MYDQNRQATQGLASFYFFHQNILFFSCRLFSINLKPFSPSFIIFLFLTSFHRSFILNIFNKKNFKFVANFWGQVGRSPGAVNHDIP